MSLVILVILALLALGWCGAAEDAVYAGGWGWEEQREAEVSGEGDR
jgi:hypothetical protein